MIKLLVVKCTRGSKRPLFTYKWIIHLTWTIVPVACITDTHTVFRILPAAVIRLARQPPSCSQGNRATVIAIPKSSSLNAIVTASNPGVRWSFFKSKTMFHWH